MNTTEFKKQIIAMIEETCPENEDLNEIVNGLHDSIDTIFSHFATAHGWTKWGDGKWREATACALCGSSLPGICGHQDNPNQVVLRGLAALAAQRKANGESK